MNLELKNKVVVITGGTGGIGRQIVLDFLSEGARVICLIRNQEKMKALIRWVGGMNVDTKLLFSHICDLLDYDEIHATIEGIVKNDSCVDVLVNCAGHAEELPFGLLSKEQIDRGIDINFRSPVYLCKSVLKPMIRQKHGSIINISSITAIKKGRGVSVYAAAKSGIDNFTRVLASEVGKKNIRVNCIRPGLILTKMSEPLVRRLKDFDKLETSLERHGLPIDVSKATLFLASDVGSSFITGECINIDGGIF